VQLLGRTSNDAGVESSSEEVGFVDEFGGIVSWIIFGALVGWLASKLAGTDSQQGWIANIILGVVGAIVAGAIYGWIRDRDEILGWNIGSLILGVIGAFVLSWGYAYVMGRKA
jgi:uncharacterized membrane protein YeaQ/YmgE (transglycosylase-associated protein family)